MILRCRRFYPCKVLLRLYKQFVLSGIEFATPAIYHATDYALSPLERVQRRMLDELQYTEKDALLDHALAPLQCRRDMAMLGLLHRIIMGWAPACLQKFIYYADAPTFPRSYRAPDLRHNRQIHDVSSGSESRLFQRSIFKLVYTCNVLPQIVVDSRNVHIFQKHLQRCLKHVANGNLYEWPFLFTRGIRTTTVAKFHSLFNVRTEMSNSFL